VESVPEYKIKILSMKNVKAAIFDMDGVIVDSKPHHMKAWGVFCRKHGLSPISKSLYDRIAGNSTAYFLDQLFKWRLSEEEAERYSKEKDQFYLQTYGKRITIVGGLINFLEKLKAEGVAIAVATSEPPTTANFILSETGTRQYFKEVIYGSQIKRPKPDPEIYLMAAEAVGASPSLCVAFEDTPVGIQAAKSAGMKVVGLATTYQPEKLGSADLVVENFLELTLRHLNELSK